MSFFRRWANVLKPQPGSVLTGVSAPDSYTPPPPVPDNLDADQEVLANREGHSSFFTEPEPLADWERELLEGPGWPDTIKVRSVWSLKEDFSRKVRVTEVFHAGENDDDVWKVEVERLRFGKNGDLVSAGGKRLIRTCQEFVDGYDHLL